MATEPHPHDWITILGDVRCELCGAQKGSRAGDKPCTVPYPAEPPPVDPLWQLILTDNPAEIARLEAELEGTQAEAVNEMIEDSCWSDDLPKFVGGKGTAAERRSALRKAYLANRTSLGHG